MKKANYLAFNAILSMIYACSTTINDSQNLSHKKLDTNQIGKVDLTQTPPSRNKTIVIREHKNNLPISNKKIIVQPVVHLKKSCANS